MEYGFADHWLPTIWFVKSAVFIVRGGLDKSVSKIGKIRFENKGKVETHAKW